jgi:hypothetical protein
MRLSGSSARAVQGFVRAYQSSPTFPSGRVRRRVPLYRLNSLGRVLPEHPVPALPGSQNHTFQRTPIERRILCLAG